MKRIFYILILAMLSIAATRITITGTDYKVDVEEIVTNPEPKPEPETDKGINSDFTHKDWSPDKPYINGVLDPEYVRAFIFVETYRPMTWSRVNDDINYYDKLEGDYLDRLKQQVDLANALTADFWWNSPINCSQNFYREVFIYLTAHVEGDILSEYANECWNSSFNAYKEIKKASGAEMGNDKNTAEWARRINDMLIVAKDFEIITVVGVHPENVWLANRVHEKLLPYDAIATTFYIGNSYKASENQNINTVDDLFDAAIDKWNSQGKIKMQEMFAWADSLNLEVFGYEGGQHLLAPTVNGEPLPRLVPLVIQAQTHPRIIPLMELPYNEFRRLGGKRPCFFNTLDLADKWGDWGLGRSLDDMTPKYDWWKNVN